MVTINNARISHRKLCFTYNNLNMMGEFVPRCDPSDPKGILIASVYKIFCKNGFYYMVAKLENEDFLRNYRIDKMTILFTTSITAEPLASIYEYRNNQELPLSKYLGCNYKMFHTKIVTCQFELINYNEENLNYYINTVWDELGNNNLKWKEEDKHIYFSAKLPAKGALLFTQQFGDFVRLVGPAKLYDEMRKITESMWKNYCPSE